MKVSPSLPLNSLNIKWLYMVFAVFLLASGAAWGQVEPGQLRARILEQETLLPEEVPTYDLNIDGVVDVADLR